MKLFTALFLLLLSAPVSAQNLLRQLADEVCECLSNGEIVYPRLQAGRCVEDVAKAHPRQIQAELQLSVTRAADRRQLGELLVDPLADHCAALENLKPERKEKAVRYTDIPLLRQRAAAPIAKGPEPDADSRTMQESDHPLEATGRILDQDRDRLRIRLGDGELLDLSYHPRQLRGSDSDNGSLIRVRYVADWTGGGGSIGWRLLEVK